MPSPLRAGDPARLGPYRLTARLGQGGMGTVLLGEDAAGRHVAVKVVNPDLAGDEAFRARFRREVTAARRVSRFCTAPVLDADLEHDPLYVVTEFVDGPTLEAAVRERGPLRGGDLESLAVGVATALSAIHAAGIVHRDLKPSNVLLSPTGPRVIDFGIARALEGADGPTVTGQFLGTPAYVAPELVRGGDLTPAADVFAWGCVVAFAATGRPPFVGKNVHEILYRVVHEAPVLDGLDDGLRALVESSLAKDPGRRPSVPDLLATLIGATPGAELLPDAAPTAGEAAGSTGPPVPEEPSARTPPAAPTLALTRAAEAAPIPGEEPVKAQGRPDAAAERPAGGHRSRLTSRRVIAVAVAGALLLGGAATLRLLDGEPDPKVPRLGAALVPDGSLADAGSGWNADDCGVFGARGFEIRSGKDGPDWCVAPHEAPATHSVADVRVRLAGASGRKPWQAGLLLLATDDRHYGVLLRSDGSARLVKETPDGDTNVLDSVPAHSYDAASEPVRVQAEVRVARGRTSVRAWLDGDYALGADDEDEPFTKGQTALMADPMDSAPGPDDYVLARFTHFALNRAH
ncbi:protein kinase [Spirillospora sp. NPDC049652]